MAERLKESSPAGITIPLHTGNNLTKVLSMLMNINLKNFTPRPKACLFACLSSFSSSTKKANKQKSSIRNTFVHCGGLMLVMCIYSRMICLNRKGHIESFIWTSLIIKNAKREKEKRDRLASSGQKAGEKE